MEETIATAIDDLIARARAFRAGPFERQQPLYRRLVRDGQSPKILMIACSDSRVDPSIIFDSEPGQIFMVRNVASLVPPSSPDGRCHGTSAAIEFGVLGLGVAHIVVLGHGHCGGIDALLRGADRSDVEAGFIGPWLASAAEVRDRLLREMPEQPHEQQARALEYATVRQSLQNLLTFPWVEQRVREGSLSLHGWHFDIAEGALSALDESGEAARISG
jgi:carbonic anhydrase